MSFITSPKPSSETSNWRLSLFHCPTQFPIMPLLLPQSSHYSYPGSPPPSFVSLSLMLSPSLSVSTFVFCFFSPYLFPIHSPFSCSRRALAWLSRSDRRIPLVFTILKPLSCSDSLLSPATSQLWLHTSLGSHCLLTDHCHFPSCSPLMVPPSSAALTPPIPTPTPSRQACASPLPYQCNYFFDKPSISLNFKSTLHWYPLLSFPLQLLPSLPPDRACMREYDIRHH